MTELIKGSCGVFEGDGNRRPGPSLLKAAYSDVSCELKVEAGRSDPFEVSS